ncbi:hypothetical protein HWI79_1503 [Cryptosporidium felis]|nr:hypothetical protein HWI79_1503 [Cryptosporidium felis]
MLIFTLYGIYVYFKKSLYIELRVGTIFNKSSTSIQDSRLSVSERYNKEKQKYINDEIIYLNQGESSSRDKGDISKGSQNNALIEAAVEDSYCDVFHSFFGLITNSPKSTPMCSPKKCINTPKSSQVSAVPSVLANTFIKAANAMSNNHIDSNSGTVNTTVHQIQTNPSITPDLCRFSERNDAFNNQKYNSVGNSFRSNMRFARYKFESYLSSFHNKITSRRVGNSLPGSLIPSCEAGQDKCILSKTKKSSPLNNNLLQLLDDNTLQSTRDSFTPTRKAFKGFLSPLPTVKSSPILLLTERKNEHYI